MSRGGDNVGKEKSGEIPNMNANRKVSVFCLLVTLYREAEKLDADKRLKHKTDCPMYVVPDWCQLLTGGAEHISPLRTSPIYQPKRYCQRGRSFLRRKRAPKKI